MKNFNNKYKTNFRILKFFAIPWFLLFLLLTMAFSGFTDELKTQSLAYIESYIYDYVYITNVRVSETSNASSLYNVHLSNETNTATNVDQCNSYIIYDVDIVNSTSAKAFITNTSVVSAVNQAGNSTTGFDITFLDVVNNETYINPHETRTIKIKVKNNCTTSDKEVNVKTNFEYSLFPYHTLTINVIPNTAEINLETSEGEFTATGTLTQKVYETDTVTYSASQRYYYSQSGEYTMGNQDHTINIELVEDPRRTISIVPDAPGQNCHCYANGVTIFYTEDYTEATAVVNKGDELSCSVGINNGEENDYYYRYDQGEDKYYGYYTSFTITEDTTLTPQFTYKPSIEGTVTNNGYNTAKTGTLKNLHKGYYLVKLWGGQGGKGYESKAGAGGKYGYVYGVVYLNYGDIINYSLGGNGQEGVYGKAKQQAGGANGGGMSAYDDKYNRTGGTGGGYSTLTNANNTIYLMIAAGGGGGSGPTGAAGAYKGGNGGAGGNNNTQTASYNNGTVFYGLDGEYGYHSTTQVGKGGTTTGGTNTRVSRQTGREYLVGSQFQGGHAEGRGGAGGGGLFGGGAGYTQSSESRSPIGNHAVGTGGGGGSSYIYNTIQYLNLPSSIMNDVGDMTNPSAAKDSSNIGGAIEIKYYGKEMPTS